MSPFKQKDFVVDQVKTILGSRFIPGTTFAITALTHSELELIKERTYAAILSGNVEYSKDVSNLAEVRTYSRSMVMNHLKKAKELNGNMVYSSSTNAAPAAKVPKKQKGIDTALLPQELQEYVRNLV